jgi:Protein kinase domain/Concanavalin A-like lectin/glucanases superfamily
MNERDVFLAAQGKTDPAARAAFLDEACAGDAALRQQVERLLRADWGPDSLLDPPTVPQSDPGQPETHDCPNPAEQDSDEPLSFLAPPGQPDSLGRIGHHEVLEVLGKGGFGIVFRALDTVLKRLVAVKVLAPLLAVTSPARQRFLREARSSAAVRHDNVVQVYEVGEQPLPYLVMEFIPGVTLQQRIDRLGPLEIADVLLIGRQIAEGLAAAHATGLIHRDVKPANVLLEVGPQTCAKLTDFGLARAADDASISGSGLIAGTPMYMSPEQARGEHIDHRTDLFSLGSLLYVMTSGRPPFRAANTLAVLKRVNEDAPRPIAEIIPEAPRWLCDIIARLHAKNPDERFQSAQEVADLLARCQTQFQHGRNGPELGLAAIFPDNNQRAAGKGWRVEENTTLHPPPATRHPEGRIPHGRRLFAAAAVLFLLAAGLGLTEATGVTRMGGTIVRLFTSEGALVVESDDPDVRITVDGEDVIIAGAGVKELRVTPGQHKVQASKDGKFVTQQLVTVTKNGKEVVRISREIPAGVKGAAGPNHALHFDGLGGHVAIPTLKRDAGKEPITIEAWVRPDSERGNDVAVLLGGSGRCQLGRNGVRWEAIDFTGGWLTHEPAEANKIVHLAYSSDGKTARFFIDGKLVAAAATGKYVYADQSVPMTHTWIAAEPRDGKTARDLGFPFKGAVGEVRISSVARYTRDFTPRPRHAPDKDAIALYHFDDGAGDKLTDSSGNGHHGKIVGARWVQWNTPPIEPSVDLDPNRRAALWLRSLGPIRVDVSEGDGPGERKIFSDQPLPEGPFRLVNVVFRGPEVDKLGDRLAEKLAVQFKGVQLRATHLPTTQSFTTAGLAKLLQLPAYAELSYLSVFNCGVDDGMFAHVAKLPGLTNLDGGALPNVTGKGLHALKACPHLQHLSLFSTQLSAEGIRELRQLPALDYLNISSTPCTAEHMAALTRLKLTRLHVNEAGITDALAAPLAEMEQLEQLGVWGNPLTDKTLAAFKKLKRLQTLDIHDTQATEAGVAELQKALPNCKIQRQ